MHARRSTRVPRALAARAGRRQRGSGAPFAAGRRRDAVVRRAGALAGLLRASLAALIAMVLVVAIEGEPSSAPANYVAATQIAPAGSDSYVAFPATTLGNDGSIEALDSMNGDVVGSALTVGVNPGAIAVDPTSSQLVVANSGDSVHSATTASIVSLTGTSPWSVTSTVSGLPTGAKPAAAMDTEKGLALVVDAAADDVSVISMAGTPSLVGNLSLGISGGQPSAIAISPNGMYAVVTVPGSSEVVELQYNGVAGDDDFLIANDYSGTSFTPEAVAIAGDGNLAYVTNSSTDVIDKIDISPQHWDLQSSTISLSAAPSAIAAAANGDLYVSVPSADEIGFVNVNGNSSPVVSYTSVASAPGPLALNADDSILEMASSATSAVQLLDTATAASAETASSLPNTPSAIATYPTNQVRFFAYVANSGSGTVSVIDTITDSVVTTLTVGTDPDAIAIEPDDSAVFVANQGSNTISVIDPADIWSATNPVVATISTSSGLSSGADPDALTLTPSGDDLLVAEYGTGQVQVVDADPNDASYLDVVTGSSPIDLNGSSSSSSIEPTAIAVAPSGQYAWVVDNGADGITTLEQSSAAGGYAFESEETTHLGMTAPYGIAVAPNGANIYVTDDHTTSDGDLWDWPITSSGSSIGQPEATDGYDVTVGHSPRQVSLSPEGQTAYVSNSGSGGGVSVVDTATFTVSATSSLSSAYGGAVAPDGSLYLASSDASSGTVSVFDAAGNASVASVAVGSDPVALAFGGQFSAPGPVQRVVASDLAGGGDNPSEAWQGAATGFQQISSSTAFSSGVDPATGAYDLTIPVFAIPDVGPSLDLALTYDSDDAATLGDIGDGWAFSYGMTFSGPTYSSATHLCTITLSQEDASTVRFVHGSSGSCPTTGYAATSPAEQAMLGHVTSCVGSDACYVLTRADGTKYKIDATTGLLADIVDPDGNTISLAYTSGELHTVSAQGGRALTFSWSGGLISQVTDGLGRKIAFTYSSDELSEITETATADPTTHYFQFSYNSGTDTLSDWWSPTNDPTGSGPSDSVETAVSYNSAGQVDEVAEPQRSCVESSSTVNCNPQWTFSWPSWDATSGTGAVLVSDPNENAGMTNGDVALDIYADFVLVSQLRGYGPGLPGVDASVETLSVRSPASLLAVERIDGNANVTSTLYDGQGMPLVSIDPLGRTTIEEYNGYAEKIAALDPMGNETQYVYDNYNENASGYDLYETIDPEGNVSYDNFSGGSTEPYSAEDANSNTTDYTYDTNGDLTKTVDPAGDTTETLYDAVGEQCATLSAVEEASGNTLPASCPSSAAAHYTADVGYDFFGQELEKITPSSAAGGTTIDGYDPDGNETSVEDPDSQTTSYTFNADDEETEEELPSVTAGTPTTTYGYDPDGNQVTMTKPLGNVGGCGCAAAHTWTSAYDNLGREVSVTDPQGNTTSYSYDGDNNQLTVTPPATTHSQETTNTYDADNDLLTSTNNLGDEWTYGYDADGEQDCEADPNAEGYDGITCPADPTGAVSGTTTTTYTPDGKVATSENPLGNVTTYYYDADNNELAYTEPEGDPATCDPLTTSHCAYTYYFIYNDDDQMSSMTTPPTKSSSTGETTDYTYTPDGDAYQTTDPLGQVTTDGYDEADRLTSVGYADTVNSTPNVTYSYTNEGKTYQMTDGTGTTTYTYDADGNTTEIENGAGAVLSFTYDLDGNNTCIAYSITTSYSCSSSPGSSNHVVDYTYDHDDRLSTITDWVGDTLTYTYNHESLVQELSANDAAVTEDISYDAGGNTTEIDASTDSTTLLELQYAYDYDHDPVQETPTIGTTTQTVEDFAVDPADQVDNFWTGTGSAPSPDINYGDEGEIEQNGTVSTAQGMGYDEAGELCWASTSTSSNACSSPPSGATAYAYDADSERTLVTPPSGNDQSYDWNAANELACANTNGSSCSLTSPTATTTLYDYNGNGLRTSSTSNSATTGFVWDTANYEAVPQLVTLGTTSYVYGAGTAAVMQINGSTSDLLISDPEGSVHGLVQLTAGSLQDKLVNYTDYDAYGNPSDIGGLTQQHTSLNSNWSATSIVGFAASLEDPTGLVYMQHRYYDPTTAQFISVDPLELATDKAFEYADNDPLMVTDLTGQIAAVPLVVNPYGCNGYVGNAHWAGSNPKSGIIKVNGGIVDCSHEPLYGLVEVSLMKTGLFVDYLQAQTTCSTDMPNTACPWFYRKPSSGGYQMLDQETQKQCTYDSGVTSTFYGQVNQAVIDIDGVFYYAYNIYSAQDFNASNCWTSS